MAVLINTNPFFLFQLTGRQNLNVRNLNIIANPCAKLGNCSIIMSGNFHCHIGMAIYNWLQQNGLFNGIRIAHTPYPSFHINTYTSFRDFLHKNEELVLPPNISNLLSVLDITWRVAEISQELRQIRQHLVGVKAGSPFAVSQEAHPTQQSQPPQQSRQLLPKQVQPTQRRMPVPFRAHEAQSQVPQYTPGVSFSTQEDQASRMYFQPHSGHNQTCRTVTSPGASERTEGSATMD